MTRRLGAISIALAFTATAAPANAQVEWQDDWPKFSTSEATLTGALVLTIGVSALLVPSPPSGWRRDLFVDNYARENFTLQGDARHRAETASDILQYALFATTVIDSVGLAGFVHDRWDVAGQMLLMDLEAAAVTGTLLMLTKRVVGRARPDAPPCPSGGFGCRSSNSRQAFVSGHTAASFTAGALVCAHRRHFTLSGNKTADAMSCAAAMAMSLGTGLMRVTSERHWMTDIMGGAAIGLTAGMLVPELLHYARAQPNSLLQPDLRIHALGVNYDNHWGYGLDGSLEVHAKTTLSPYVRADGRLVSTRGTRAVRQIGASLGGGYQVVTAGIYVGYRATERPDAEARRQGLVGPELRVRLPGAHPLELSGRWLWGAGQSARIDFSPWSKLALRAEVARLEEGALVLIGAGGRWPW